ncbi:chalcone isomerase family protein [Neptunomonas antarctica]|uniref:Chalcone isomerase-like n=1 Tax=Neptunomonas antarctica TaxID=619304 RepID=A0A1N7LPM4_9GAMM|nr:chalcone isomerase family protein [Neptunomonas antarctica]SIS75742.1 Chalcone isomerase-like [Neptunomonas antarctica]
MFIKVFFCALLLCSFAVSGKMLPQNWTRVGEAELSILWFDVYKAELLTPDGFYSDDNKPLILNLNYRRNISRKDLLQETRKQIQQFAGTEQVDHWLNKLLQIWPDILKGDQLTFWLDSEGDGHFFYNKGWIGSLKDPAFSSAFIKIWLSDKSNYPDLAKQLRGEFR